MTEETSSGFALRFISGKYQGGEYALPGDKEIVVGRGGELDIVLVEDMVSRKHAMISTTGGKILIQDLGSTNGTFVNGEKIKRARLKEGDRVLIGTSILKLIAASEATNAIRGSREELNASLDALGRSQAGKTDITSGSIADLPLADFLTLLSSNKKDGVLAVKNDNGDEGRVYFKGGRIIYAILNDDDELGPLKALFRMVAFVDGSYDLGAPSDEEFMLELEEATDQLVAEAVRQSKDMRALQAELPELEDMISWMKPLKSALSSLQGEELDVMQLAFNEGFFQVILDKSPHTDLKTAQMIKSLIEREYLKV